MCEEDKRNIVDCHVLLLLHGEAYRRGELTIVLLVEQEVRIVMQSIVHPYHGFLVAVCLLDLLYHRHTCHGFFLNLQTRPTTG